MFLKGREELEVGGVRAVDHNAPSRLIVKSKSPSVLPLSILHLHQGHGNTGVNPRLMSERWGYNMVNL